MIEGHPFAATPGNKKAGKLSLPGSLLKKSNPHQT
jgi:hypothetical protein